MATRDDQLIAYDSTNTNRIVITGSNSEITIESAAQNARLRMIDKNGDETFVLDGENSSLQGNKGGSIDLRDGTKTRLSSDGGNGNLGVKGVTGSLISASSDADDASAAIGPLIGVIVRDDAGVIRCKIHPGGNIETYDSSGNLTIKLDSGTGDIRLKGSVQAL